MILSVLLGPLAFSQAVGRAEGISTACLHQPSVCPPRRQVPTSTPILSDVTHQTNKYTDPAPLSARLLSRFSNANRLLSGRPAVRRAWRAQWGSVRHHKRCQSTVDSDVDITVSTLPIFIFIWTYRLDGSMAELSPCCPSPPPTPPGHRRHRHRHRHRPPPRHSPYQTYNYLKLTEISH